MAALSPMDAAIPRQRRLSALGRASLLGRVLLKSKGWLSTDESVFLAPLQARPGAERLLVADLLQDLKICLNHIQHVVHRVGGAEHLWKRRQSACGEQEGSAAVRPLRDLWEPPVWAAGRGMYAARTDDGSQP